LMQGEIKCFKAVNDWSLSGHPLRAVAWLTDKHIGIVTIRECMAAQTRSWTAILRHLTPHSLNRRAAAHRGFYFLRSIRKRLHHSCVLGTRDELDCCLLNWRRTASVQILSGRRGFEVRPRPLAGTRAIWVIGDKMLHIIISRSRSRRQFAPIAIRACSWPCNSASCR
jgi:hypothetical protein